MIIQDIKLRSAWIYGGVMPGYDGKKGTQKAWVMALYDDQADDRLAEHFNLISQQGPHAGNRQFKCSALRPAFVDVVGDRYTEFREMLETLDVMNVERNEIFKCGPVSLDVEMSVKEYGDNAAHFWNLSKIIVDVDRLDITQVMR